MNTTIITKQKQNRENDKEEKQNEDDKSSKAFVCLCVWYAYRIEQMSIGDSCIPWELKLVDKFVSIGNRSTSSRMTVPEHQLDGCSLFSFRVSFLLLLFALSCSPRLRFCRIRSVIFKYTCCVRLSLHLHPIRSFINN